MLPSGKRLASALYELKMKDESNLTVIGRMVNRFLPNFIAVDVKDDKENMRYVLRMQDKNMQWYTSRVLSEGTLRVLALCVLAVDGKHGGLICFEEPENGVHPKRISQMANLVKELSADFSEEIPSLRQTIVNTHSPLFVRSVDAIADRDVQIYLSRMVSATAMDGDAVHKLSKTKITPVVKEGRQPVGDYSEQDLKLSARDIQEYLCNEDTPLL